MENEKMANIICDTKKVRTCGKDIITLADDFENIIQTLFNRISTITTRDDIWSGNDAEKYVTQVIKDKEEYMRLYYALKQFGLCYQQVAEYIENGIQKIDINL